MSESTIHVICCNDSVEFAVINDEKEAKRKMDELKKNYYERNKHSFACNWDRYCNICYWHIHSVGGY